MCGIAGLAGKDAGQFPTDTALNSLRHRGPDGNGIYRSECLTLLHTRLAIQDLSTAAAQPMQDPEGRYVLCYNGEIYNHLSLRALLPQLSFRGHSDTETLLQLLIHFGAEVVEKLNGIFAFAFYDSKANTLLLARDHFGVKPLYYCLSENSLSFASELKTLRLLIPNIQCTLNPDALFQSLQLQYNLPEQTGFKEIHRLKPGTTALFDLNRQQASVQMKPSTPYIKSEYLQYTEEEWIHRLAQELYRAVERQLLSEKEISFFLSGGIDSSLLVAIASDITQSPLHTYTIRTGNAFTKEGFSEDFHFAKAVATAGGHYLHTLEADNRLLETLDETILKLEELQADPAAFFTGHIAAAARRQGHEVMIGGAGADDLFSGYRRHAALHYFKKTDRVPRFVPGMLSKLSTLLPGAGGRRAVKLLSLAARAPEQRRIQSFRWAGPERVLPLFSEGFREQLTEHCVEAYFSQTLSDLPEGVSELDRILHLEQKIFLPHNLNYLDKMGMAQGVEIRVPYIDNELARFAASIPPELKMKGTETKYLLRKVARKYLPDAVIDRPKTGFGAPLREWLQHDPVFRTQLQDRISTLISHYPEYFNGKAIQELFRASIRKQTDGVYTLFALACIESWLRQFTTN